MGQIGMKKKIAVVIPQYGLVGGGEQFALQLMEKNAQNPRYDDHIWLWRIMPGKTGQKTLLVKLKFNFPHGKIFL